MTNAMINLQLSVKQFFSDKRYLSLFLFQCKIKKTCHIFELRKLKTNYFFLNKITLNLKLFQYYQNAYSYDLNFFDENVVKTIHIKFTHTYLFVQLKVLKLLELCK